MKFSIAGELLVFLWQVKLWWMIPLVTLLLLLGLLLTVAESPLAPLIYTMF